MTKKIKPLIAITFVIVTICFANSACTYSSRDDNMIAPCNITTASFQLNIKPILDANCIVCHSAAEAAGGLNFESYSGVHAPAMDGRLVGSVKHLAGFIPMPEFAPKLSGCDIMKIETWVKQGALNN